MQLAKPNTIGVAYSSSMIVPCMVNSWLYCSLDKNCKPGAASSVRISSAINPPTRKNPIEVTMYIMPDQLGIGGRYHPVAERALKSTTLRERLDGSQLRDGAHDAPPPATKTTFARGASEGAPGGWLPLRRPLTELEVSCAGAELTARVVTGLLFQ